MQEYQEPKEPVILNVQFQNINNSEIHLLTLPLRDYFYAELS
jgi:hypothetical protein